MANNKTPEERIGVVESDVHTLKAETEKQWQAIDKLRNRLPHWATLLISLLTFALGVVSTLAFK